MTLEELGRRAVACKHFRWMEGMQVEPLRFRVVWMTEDMIGESDQVSYFWKNVPDIYPDLSDPATLGCLLALVREAWNDHSLCANDAGPYDLMFWHVYTDDRNVSEGGQTEAEALVAALEAAP